MDLRNSVEGTTARPIQWSKMHAQTSPETLHRYLFAVGKEVSQEGNPSNYYRPTTHDRRGSSNSLQIINELCKPIDHRTGGTNC